eukprot:CAMPEP_0117425256 /NCGR_PEP_ID=MMETSP0758-20121206/5558_1 /TAXON_ID=63605 /ORGANISM="Percolomonas cosmopolitus, Strain AE-1 (ATCC 50343)" /LENGTH=654 /DNA_ID=CAMNT_0005209619 /DNA_START=95 /DNA_END=2059 /DNA_ORIENTATION=-
MIRKAKERAANIMIVKQRLITILYGTERGLSKKLAEQLAKELKIFLLGSSIRVKSLKDYAYDEKLPHLPTTENDATTKGFRHNIIFVLPTYENGTPPEEAKGFYTWLEDFSHDFRVHQTAFSHIHYAVFGVGDSAFGSRFCTVAKNVHKWMKNLDAKPLLPEVTLGDNGAAADIVKQFETNFEKPLVKTFLESARALLEGKAEIDTPAAEIETLKPKNEIKKVVEEEEEDDEEEENQAEPTLDIEDMGEFMRQEQEKKEEPKEGEKKQMLTPLLRKSLTKQGYKLIGSHSGVKLCRWTKSMLRGRGGCYKHTAYGIASYQCMEMTPSLACANKCTFCWRHHSNPVARSWQWEMDDPEFLIEQSIEKHQKMIKVMKGIPDVKPERYREAFNVRHCALSLVGEPIIYPKINKFMDMLHQRKISSFLVTNAQFPDQLQGIKRCTQLYVSIDAPTKEAMAKVDRPVFEDFWERFITCLDILREKKMRTVYRLTLIKDQNMDDMEEYVKLIARGVPSFIEIKGVTFCGSSQSSNMTMKNVPFNEEVLEYALSMCKLKGMEDYEVAAVHAHSCFVLIAHKKFYQVGQWKTWIDYDKFHELVASGKEFTDLDYVAPTPEWALLDSKEQGFDPVETRFKRKSKKEKQLEKQKQKDALAKKLD